MDQHKEEASRFDDISDHIAKAQEKTWAAVERIASLMKPGMRESEAIRIGQRTLAEMGSKKFWHKCHIRFGSGTIKSFNDTYDDNVLREDDIFYIDIGPIWEGIEGDAGKTFVIGKNAAYQKGQEDCQCLFNKVAQYWRDSQVSGKDLYEYANGQAREMGWVLAPNYVRGHRLAEFPHSFHSKLTLNALDFVPSKNRWVLEIHICNPELSYGAFFEDVLA